MVELVPVPSPGETVFYGEPGNPVVVVLHDMFGRLPWLDSYATALSSRGLYVAVPDLHDGMCTTDAATAHDLANAVDVASALSIVGAAVDEARETGVERVGLAGFGIGGWLALLYAQGGEVDATVTHYASLSAADHSVIPSPVLLQWAEREEWDAGDEPEAFMERLAAHGTPLSRHSYVGTRHGFANASVPEVFDAQAAALAFARTAVFLETHLVD